MKNYVYLMMVLGLAACASGGEGPDSRFRVSSSSQYFAVATDAAKSNKNVTSMDSEIIVCDGGCPAHLDRYISNVSHQHRLASSTALYEGSGFKVYGLDNATFTTSDAPGTEKFTFVIEDDEASEMRGKITQVKWDSGAHILTRQTVTENVFKNSDDDFTLTYNSLAENKLRFSDFGKIETNEASANKYMFAGGYEKLQHDAPTSNMSFTGTAAGIVSSGTYSQNVKGNATLDFNDGTETLNMNFASGETPWYNVEIIKSDTVNKIIFTDTENVNANVKFNDFSDGARTKDFTSENMNVGYYGHGTNVSEATGVVKYTEADINMDAAFGVKKNN